MGFQKLGGFGGVLCQDVDSHPCYFGISENYTSLTCNIQIVVAFIY